ncbi:unnamed protein product [Fraxinus pennsylvanica]|uniref:WHIM1 domain-containing protein n=1 Tax=Fraxinus pennsylvanica TaxID=56036 RepID=A0AAD2E6V4_9LAMI|nr:unnamed protein product [Fraxinus pennsylvanica]
MCLDWSLLDSFTWPVYLVNYLMVMGYIGGPDWKGFYTLSLESDYYTSSVGRKLMILQILCDDILDSEELRVEIDTREESEVGIDSDTGTTVAPAGGPRRVHLRYSKTSACKDKDAIWVSSEGVCKCWHVLIAVQLSAPSACEECVSVPQIILIISEIRGWMFLAIRSSGWLGKTRDDRSAVIGEGCRLLTPGGIGEYILPLEEGSSIFMPGD